MTNHNKEGHLKEGALPDKKEKKMAAKKDAPAKSWEEQKVTVRLFKDNERYKDDVTVIVNGRTWRIQRGKEVEIPLYVWNVIKNGMEQDFNTADLIQREEEAFKDREKKYT